MTLISFYQKSLLIPPIVLGLISLSYLIFELESSSSVWISGIGVWGLILGGVPYIFLSCWLVVQSRKHSARWLKEKLALALTLLLALIIVWIFFILFFLSIISSSEFVIRDYYFF